MKVTNYYSLQPIVRKILSSCAQLVNNHEHNCVYNCLYKCKTSVSHTVLFPLWIYVSNMYTDNISLFNTMLESLCHL